MTTEPLLLRLHERVARETAKKVRDGRRRALAVLLRHYVVVTDDGVATREEWFDQPPTMRELLARIGPDRWVVSVGMRRRSQRNLIAAE